jgi:phosphoserine aminotransferase
MKTYQVSFKYETYANYTVEAEDRDHAENLALDMLKLDEGDYLHHGSWTETEIEEATEEQS